MQAIQLNIHREKLGKLWQRKTSLEERGEKFIKKLSLLHNGLILHISSMNTENINTQNKFILVDVGKNDHQFIACDNQRRVYRFDMDYNRYSWIITLPLLPCGICWNKRTLNHVLISLSNSMIIYVDIVLKSIVGELTGLNFPAANINVHPKENLALSYSSKEATLWDLDSLVLKHNLIMKQDVEILFVSFMGSSNIITCFKDNSVFIWDLPTMNCIHHLFPPEELHFPYTTLSFDSNNQCLFAGGSSPTIHVWDVTDFILKKVLHLPSEITSVKSILVINEVSFSLSKQILGLFTSNNSLHVIDVMNECILFDFKGGEFVIRSVLFSCLNTYLAVILDSGSIGIYFTCTLAAINIPDKVTKEVEIKTAGSKEKLNIPTNQNIRSWPEKPFSQGTGKMLNRQLADKDLMLIHEDLPKGKLDNKKLKKVLKEFGEYPERYRHLIWKNLLLLPENKDAFEALLQKGVHVKFENISEQYPIRDSRLLRVFQKILSALAHWSPSLAYVDYLPMFVFPFVKLFTNNLLLCFELTASILINYCQHWFQYYPCPPVSILNMTESVLDHHDAQLLQHFKTTGITSQVFAWPLLQTAFSEIFAKEEWLKIWDHLLSNDACLSIAVIVAYNKIARYSLLQCKRMEDFEFFFHHQNAINVSSLIKEMYKIHQETPKEIYPKTCFKSFVPLTKRSYPVFKPLANLAVDSVPKNPVLIPELEKKNTIHLPSVATLEKNLKNIHEKEEVWKNTEKLLKLVKEEQAMLSTVYEKQLDEDRKNIVSMKKELNNLKERSDPSTTNFVRLHTNRHSENENRGNIFNSFCREQAKRVDLLTEKQKLELELTEYRSCPACDWSDIDQYKSSFSPKSKMVHFSDGGSLKNKPSNQNWGHHDYLFQKAQHKRGYAATKANSMDDGNIKFQGKLMEYNTPDGEAKGLHGSPNKSEALIHNAFQVRERVLNKKSFSHGKFM